MQQNLNFKRSLEIFKIPNPIKKSSAAFLWGPRQTGKTTLLKEQFPKAKYYDLLDTSLNAQLGVQPHDLTQEILAQKPNTVVIDEIQKLPNLLEEIHWLLENTATNFILCGSSARKLKRQAKNLLGGRAINFYLFPLTSHEVPNFDLNKFLNHGGLPVPYLVEDPSPILKAYVNNYVKEEIIDESLTRNVPSFSKFLQTVALTHGQQLNYSNISRECGVANSTVRNYYQILKDTLLGFELEPWRQSKKRRLVESSKFYLFDIGVANYLHPEALKIVEGTDLYGQAFEHFLIGEIRAYLSYNQKDVPMCYWRTSSGHEVDLILGNMDVAIEFKSHLQVRSKDVKSLKTLQEEFPVKKKLLVNRSQKRLTRKDEIEVFPWQEFCEQLWAGKII